MNKNLEFVNKAPIIIFAFNRPKSFETIIEALNKCPEAQESDLYVFIDGPRKGREREVEKVSQVVAIANSIEGFKSVIVNKSTDNKGLGHSIILGVSEIINRYGHAIVLEDDLIVQPNFLNYLNYALNTYKNCPEVFSVCGYTNKIKKPNNYQYDSYFCPRSSSWGWATWVDRWNSVDWELADWQSCEANASKFNKWGGSDCFGMLKGWKDGKNKSWAIRFCYSQFVQNKLSLFPVKSLVKNDGFDGSGTNCRRYSRFKYELGDPKKIEFKLPSETEINKSILKQFLSYNGLLIRIWSRLMYMIKG